MKMPRVGSVVEKARRSENGEERETRDAVGQMDVEVSVVVKGLESHEHDHAVTTIHEIRTTFTPKVNVGLSSMVCEIDAPSKRILEERLSNRATECER